MTSSTQVTQPQVAVGTTDYMAPEQWEGARVDARTDGYSLGCVLFQALTGQVPYPRDTEGRDCTLTYTHHLGRCRMPYRGCPLSSTLV